MNHWQTKIQIYLRGIVTGIFSPENINEKTLIFPGKENLTPKKIIEIDSLSALTDLKDLFKNYKELCNSTIKKPEITHPISGERLVVHLTPLTLAGESTIEILNTILNGSNRSDKMLFYSLYELFKEKLTSEDNDLGPVWKKIPCDWLIPDHSVWHHNALASALCASGKEPHLLFFSFGPMNFVSPSLTLREYWAASLMLSYFLWSGMRAVCDEFGPDHILYPAVSGQPLFHRWLIGNGMTELSPEFEKSKMGIPSFSNSFVAVLPKNSLKSMIQKIESSIMGDWKIVSNSVFEKLSAIKIKGKGISKELWDRDISNYWVFRNGASPWLKSFDDPLLKETSLDIAGARETAALFKEISGNSSMPGVLYQASHELSQKRNHEHKMSLREREKSKAPSNRCSLCDKNSISYLMEDPVLSNEYLKSIQEISASELLDSERLCPVCMTRRFASHFHHALPQPLKEIFQNTVYADFFASEKSREYIAILSMDGDEMGNLVKGKNKKYASWKEIMHSTVPAIIAELNRKNIPGPWGNMEKILNKKRMIFPSVHQFLSESLADFSLYTVPYVIKKYKGRILYAGGDDVIAALPVHTALQAAQEIRDFYRTAFAKINSDGTIEPCVSEYTPAKGERLLTHLGKAVTMSAAVVFAKHDEHAGELLSFARKMVDDEAKDNAGRDALAVVIKEGGGIKAKVTGKWVNSDGSRFINELISGAKNSSLKDEKNDSNGVSNVEKIMCFLAKYMDK